MPGSNGMTWEEYRDIALQMYFRRQIDEDTYFEKLLFVDLDADWRKRKGIPELLTF